jgi:putative ABC transport system permease protein
MSIWRLILCEIGYRKVNFGLAVLSVAVAVGGLMCVLNLLRLYDRDTEQLVAAQLARTDADMRRLEDDYRKITLKLGFDIRILPKDQNLADFHARDYAAKTMPEEYVTRLANSKIVTINHLLPCLEQRVLWTEEERTIVLCGVRGEVPISHQDPKKPLIEQVPPGTMVVGHELHRGLKLTKGQKVKLLGRELVVHHLHPPRGTRDDITIWINLAEAQTLLGKPGQINGILALECNCADADRLGKVREEITAILPDTQVEEIRSQALTRAEARNRAAAARLEAAQRLRAERAESRQQFEGFAAILLPILLLGSIVWLGVLAFGNVRDRSSEIGILRAIGIGSGAIFMLFLARAALIGLLGAAAGYLAATILALVWADGEIAPLDPLLAGGVFLATPLVCMLASWMPALVAARQDPAVVLREN